MSRLICLSLNRTLLDSLKRVLADDHELRIIEHPAALGEYPSPVEPEEEPVVLLVDADALSIFSDRACRRMVEQAHECRLSVILLGGALTEAARLRAARYGVDDFIRQPFLKPIVEGKLQTHIRLRSLERSIDAHKDVVAHLQSELAVVQDAAILSLAAVARVRDHSTGNHILRTQHYVKALAEHLRHHPRFAAELDSDTIELLYKTAALHDIGKVAIPDSILQKADSLTEAEFEIMKRHTLYGYQAMHTAEQLMEQRLGGQAARFLSIGQQVTLSHHERWDGSGYPQGLKGEKIPVVARLMAVADVYDAVSSRRPYKQALGHGEARRVILAGRGSHFDPAVVDAFVDLEATFEHVAGVLEDRFPSLTDLTLHSIEDLLPPQAE